MKRMSDDIIRNYNLHRTCSNKEVLCHAPFTNINFAQNGNMTACCFNRSHVLGKYPFQSIHDAWYGSSAMRLRKFIKEGNLGAGCKLCSLALESRNFSGSKAIYYDGYAEGSLLATPKNFFQKIFTKKQESISPPRVLEFELDNTCNLECIMCDGYFSSTIRSQRDKLPPVKNPYNENFVEQVAELLPAISDLKFLGGEPFLIEIYLKIWEKVVAIKPSIKVHITTNGTVMNQRVKDLLGKLNCGIVVSLDSLDKENYASIRKRGNLEKVLDNIEYFSKIIKEKGTYLSLAVCPMRNNWHEMPALVEFANQRDISIHFNVVWNPGDISLRFCNLATLENICKVYSEFNPPINSSRHEQNFENFIALINQVRFWAEERKHAHVEHDRYAFLKEKLYSHGLSLTPDPLTQTCISLILAQLATDGNQTDAKQQLLQLNRTIELEKFGEAYFNAVNFILSDSGLDGTSFSSRIKRIKGVALLLPDAKTFLNDMIVNGPESQFSYFLYEDMDQLIETITSRYSVDTAIKVLT